MPTDLANHRLTLVIVLLMLTQAASAQVAALAYDPDYVIVRFAAPTTLDEAQRMLDKSRYLVTEALSPSLDIYLVKLASGMTVHEATARIKGDGKVRWVEPDHYLSLRSTTPDDPLFSSQWNLEQPSDADIDAPQAWDIATGGVDAGGNEIVVAVVDNGAYLAHLDLAPNVWVNEGEIPNNGVDDDGNGYTDDVNGWDAFYDDGTIPIPASSHGTHVAGIIGARGNNARQVAGVNWRVRVMVVAASSSKTSVVARGYSYVLAQKNRWLLSGGLEGANVVVTNSSFGVNYGNCQSDSFPIWNDLYNAMGQVGILSAAATANLSIDVDRWGDVPTGCSSPYLVSVTNTTNTDLRYGSSAWGDTTIDLGAPGTSILSTINTGTGTKTGTSMASPHVAAAVAFLHAAASPHFYVYYLDHPDSAALYLKQVLLDSVDVLPGFDTLTVSGGRLNLYRAASAVHSFVGPEPTEPMLLYAGQLVEDEITGDGDSILEAGERARLIVTVANYGAEATSVSAVLVTNDPYLTMIDSTADLGTIPASGSANNALDPFEMRADTTTPLEHEAVMTLKLTADGTYAVDRYFHLTIGQGVVYFSFDGEGSDSGWTHGPVTPGFGDQWHLSTEMCSSPTHAWKCGSMGMAGYALHLDAGLVSPAVEITPYSALYYSHWMDAEPSAVYGDSAYDGGIIEVSSAGGPFVQVTPSEGHAGWFCTVRMGLPYTGPMPGRPCYSGNIYWNQTRVDLSAYTGQTIRVRFRFGSDNDTVATEEGWYVDDIFIRGQAPPPRVVQFSFEPDSAFTQLGDTVILCGIIAASELMRGFTVYLGYDTSKVDFIDAAPGLLIEGRIGLQFYFYDHVPVLPDRLDIGAAVYGEDYWAGPGELFRARFVLRGCGDEPIVNAYAPRFVAPDGTTLPWSFEPALFLICDRVPQAPSGVKIIALPSDTVQLWWNPVTRDTLDRPLFAPTQYRVYRAQIFPAAGGPTLVLTTNDTTSVDSVGEGDAYQYHVTAETP